MSEEISDADHEITQLVGEVAPDLLSFPGVGPGAVQAVQRGATLRRTIINVPVRIARPQGRPVLHLPAHWPWVKPWLTLWDHVLGDGLPPPVAA